MKTNKHIYNLRLAAMYIAVSLFFLGSLKLPKMVLTYLGVGGNITLIAVYFFVLLDAILLAAVAQMIWQKKHWKYLLMLVAVNLLYILPYLLQDNWYRQIQYLVLMVPFSLCTYLVLAWEDGKAQFFRCLQNISRIVFVLFILYIVILFIAEPGKRNYVEIKEFTYGDVAYAALVFFFADTEAFLTKGAKQKRFAGIRILVYVAALIYSGTRSAMICGAFALVLQIFRHLPYILSVRKTHTAFCALALIACIAVCNLVIPAGSRLNVVKDDLLYELGDKEVSDIFDTPDTPTSPSEDNTVPEESIPEENTDAPTDWPSNKKLVYNVETQQFEPIDEAYFYYILNSDKPMEETIWKLRRDMKNGTGKYLYVHSSYRAAAVKYPIPYKSRVFLWSFSWGEFLSSKLIGKGCLHYQNKYMDSFPHNVVLEILADFGIVGFLIFFGITVPCFIFLLKHAWKTKDQYDGAMLAFILMYIPMHLLYHSLYFNGVLLFTVFYLIFRTVQLCEKKKQAA